MRTYSPLAMGLLPRRATFHEPAAAAAQRVSLEAPALAVMTDLRQVTAVTIDPEASIEHAMRVMVRRNVRLLLVVNIDNEIVGLITATDLLGEKPVQHMHEHGGSRADIQVRDLMTPHERLEAIDFEAVRTARVGHVLATLQHSRRQHALVIESHSHGQPRVRGIFSTSQLSRQLGETVQTGEVAHTFAEIEAALARP
jgi:signal-transduction protein with cAMP-binding, CBS, and nucleotidyltransferase domain